MLTYNLAPQVNGSQYERLTLHHIRSQVAEEDLVFYFHSKGNPPCSDAICVILGIYVLVCISPNAVFVFDRIPSTLWVLWVYLNSVIS